MKTIYKITITLMLIIGLTIQYARAQQEYQPYSFELYQKFNSYLYSTGTDVHTALKPYFIDSAMRVHYDSLTKQRWGNRKLFDEHLFAVNRPRYTFYADLLPDFGIGGVFPAKQTTSNTSLGLQLGGTVGSKFVYYVSGYQSSAIFPEYISTYINQVGIIPGQAYAKTYTTDGYEWSYLTAILSYTPNKHLNITAGRDKTFIGDGYRSMLLSDFASPYPFLKLTGNLGPVQYMAMWSYMNDPASTSQYDINRKKFGVFHYLDWNVNSRLTFGFFENIMGFFTDDNGVKRPFDFNYINPIIFMKPVNNSSSDPDKSLLGFTGKYKLSNGLTAYGQFALNEFHSADFLSNDGAYDNKYGWQLGIRGTNLFAIQQLNFLLEYNTAKPYTYSARSAIENYSENGEPLAHPWGANFRELVGLLNYSYHRFDFSGETDLGRYGLDENSLNYGSDIFQVYTDPARLYGNYTGQGLTTNMVYLEGKVAYIINPKYNLRIELGGIFRVEESSAFNDRTTWLTLGLRSSFREVYNDIASFKSH